MSSVEDSHPPAATDEDKQFEPVASAATPCPSVKRNFSGAFASATGDAGTPPPPDGAPPSPSPCPPPTYKFSDFIREDHGQPVYCAAWSDAIYGDGGPSYRLLATCGKNIVSLYGLVQRGADSAPLPADQSKIDLFQRYVDGDDGETFYAVCFGGRAPRSLDDPAFDDDGDGGGDGGADDVDGSPSSLSTRRDRAVRHRRAARRIRHYRHIADPSTYDVDSDAESDSGPVQLLAAGGTRGIVKIIDPTRGCLALSLLGHGDEIYDLRFSPADRWVLASASKDESVRLWNVMAGTCVAILAGHRGHRQACLSLDFHPGGSLLASAGMDNTVRIWDVGATNDMRAALRDSYAQRGRGYTVDVGGRRVRRPFPTRTGNLPIFATAKLHNDYVDCVRFLGDLLLTKSISNRVVLWRPACAELVRRAAEGDGATAATSAGGRGAAAEGVRGFPADVTVLREFVLNSCEIWFVRFDVCHHGALLALGNTLGEVRVWDIGPDGRTKKKGMLTHRMCKSLVRCVSFAPDRQSLVATCDDSTLWRWDAE